MGKMKERTIEELSVMPKESFVLIDIRDEGIASYGMIPGDTETPEDKLFCSCFFGKIPPKAIDIVDR